MVLESPYRLDVESVRVGEQLLAVLTVVHVAREEERNAYHGWLEDDFNGRVGGFTL